MPYADSDFFLALLKKDDWLKEKAVSVYNAYKNNIWTSGWTIVELLLIAERFEIDPERLTADIFEIATVKNMNREDAIVIAYFMKNYGLGVFDALHAISAQNDTIISSDSVFDTLGLQRIALEK